MSVTRIFTFGHGQHSGFTGHDLFGKYATVTAPTATICRALMDATFDGTWAAEYESVEAASVPGHQLVEHARLEVGYPGLPVAPAREDITAEFERSLIEADDAEHPGGRLPRMYWAGNLHRIGKRQALAVAEMRAQIEDRRRRTRGAVMAARLEATTTALGPSCQYAALVIVLAVIDRVAWPETPRCDEPAVFRTVIARPREGVDRSHVTATCACHDAAFRADPGYVRSADPQT